MLQKEQKSQRKSTSSSSSSESDGDAEVDDKIRQAAQIDYLQPTAKRSATDTNVIGKEVTDTVAMVTDYRSLNPPELFRRRMQERLDALCEQRLRFRSATEPASGDGLRSAVRPGSPPALLSARTLDSLVQPQPASEQRKEQKQQPSKKKPRLHTAEPEELKLLAVNPAVLLANSGVACHRSGAASSAER
ncbi:hypothetical protein BOX15_Mlig015301g2 [Macrostomum lignano]|uniref:Uncharacterized protein n=1 Tax=Macrostomum lignano TaxID=282301 RepID=A0A267GDW2_9PLAT|nr:hypothetical protein BOX15_Mlig015301g2 [Macrostomum lignano]